MKQLTAFVNKEFTEVCRNSKLMICGILFLLFGIMNPATAKITPWLMKNMSSELELTGIVIKDVQINALSSWEQFFKNMPIGLIIFVLMFSGIVTMEIQKGTLINMVTKGMSRWKILVAKSVMLIVVWTGCYYLSYGVTYFYTDYFWDNSIASNTGFASLGLYLLGLWLISLIILMSALAQSSTGVTLGAAGVFILCYFLGMLPKLGDYLPTGLMELSRITMDKAAPGEFTGIIVVSMVLSAINFAGGIIAFNKKNL